MFTGLCLRLSPAGRAAVERLKMDETKERPQPDQRGRKNKYCHLLISWFLVIKVTNQRSVETGLGVINSLLPAAVKPLKYDRVFSLFDYLAIQQTLPSSKQHTGNRENG